MNSHHFMVSEMMFDYLLWAMRLCSWMCLAANRSTFGGKSL
jgi:hypothetical protein